MHSPPNALAQALFQRGIVRGELLQRCLHELEQRRIQGRPTELDALLVERDLVDLAVLQELLSTLGSEPPKSKLSEIEAAPKVGRTLHGYLLEEELGRGGMGVVYRARSEQGTLVALKLLLSAKPSPNARERLRREFAAVAALDHPGIVRGLDARTEGAYPCLMLEFVRGGDLADLLDRGRPSLERGLVLMEQICEAVHHAHEHDLIHRDLKPANVLIDAEGMPKVTDFGLARELSRETRLTQTGSQLGTPAYMGRQA